MKKLILCFLSALLSLGALAQEPYPELGAKLDEYFTALAGEPASVQNKECDFLIASCQDSLVRQYVALKIYDHYLQSKIMGDDAVAVHVAQEWFLSGKVAMAEEMDLMNAKVFVEFNKSSLIGMQAPVINTFAPDGSYVKVPGEGYSVLYFYDTGCSTCKVESARLKAFVKEGKYPVTVYAIYVGQDGEAWKAYRSSFAGVTHVWAPAGASWQFQYGVLQTPRMFLVSPSGEILGRGLDTPALQLLLNREFSSGHFVYGESSQMAAFDQLFAAYGDTLKVSDVMDVADYMAARTFGEGNMDAFKQHMGDMLYYVSSRKTEVFREAAVPFVKKYIQLPEVWDTPEDQAQVVSLGELLLDLCSRTPVGTVVPDLRVPGVLRRKPGLFVSGSRAGEFKLRKLKGAPAYVVFYSANCSSCQEMLSAVERVVAENRRARVLLVDMDGLMTDAPEQGRLLLDTFDLSALPMVVELDKKGVVQHKYVDLTAVSGTTPVISSEVEKSH